MINFFPQQSPFQLDTSNELFFKDKLIPHGLDDRQLPAMSEFWHKIYGMAKTEKYFWLFSWKQSYRQIKTNLTKWWSAGRYFKVLTNYKERFCQQLNVFISEKATRTPEPSVQSILTPELPVVAAITNKALKALESKLFTPAN